MAGIVDFRPSEYGQEIAELVVRAAPNELGPGSPNRSVQSRLQSLSPSDLFLGRKVIDLDMARCCLAGLWLLHDFLDESHVISQEIETATGSYWHGIMHRREPDYGNSKYWFRRVGQHPILAPLLASIQAATKDKHLSTSEIQSLSAKTTWDPFLFVDLCEKAAQSNDRLDQECRTIGLLEWQLLFDYCYRRTISP